MVSEKTADVGPTMQCTSKNLHSDTRLQWVHSVPLSRASVTPSTAELRSRCLLRTPQLPHQTKRPRDSHILLLPNLQDIHRSSVPQQMLFASLAFKFPHRRTTVLRRAHAAVYPRRPLRMPGAVRCSATLRTPLSARMRPRPESHPYGTSRRLVRGK